jgi:tetratricopeptide (TPR) repeat protein
MKMGSSTLGNGSARFAVLLTLCALAGCSAANVPQEVALRQQEAAAGQVDNIESLTEIIEKNPQDVNALNLRGTAYGQAGDYQNAMDDFNAALKIKPDFPQAYSNRALVFVRIDSLPRAIADYDRAIEINPDYAAAYVGRGNVHRLLNEDRKAIADFTKAISIQPDPVAHFNRGLSRQKLGLHSEAIDDFDNAIGFRADAPEVYQAKGLSEMALKRYDSAYDNFYKAASGSKRNFEAWALRGQAAEALGNKQDALRAYNRSLQINPSFQPAREGLQRVESAA